ncbi:hypothetical protein SAMN04488035_1810 [Flavimobilis marinus]|uniref:Septum formation n=1 Tax=Flavimobilis marinus TaxID=285351 RepID=A0A1I2GJ30_9MICO|nr:septum formation family protein [Flavimobilis marinus]SFF17595.1 hypothetical protein SAMN04488035_1810 [Flavimobilis marinus]
MRLTKPAALLLTAALLAACGNDVGPDPTPAPADAAATATTPDDGATTDGSDDDAGGGADDQDAGDDELSLDELLGQTEMPLEVGDCWGLEDEIQLDPIPCEGPHIYEVAAVIEDWPYEQYEGGFEKGVEGDKAQHAACDAAAAAYFGPGYQDKGIVIDHNEPKFMGHEDKIVCSAHGDPATETYEEEVTGSYESRGHR